MSISVTLGPEYDEEVWRRAKAALKAAGAKLRGADWGLAGSQEIDTLTVELDGEELVLEAETYVGVTLTGGEAQVRRVERLFETGAS